MPSPEDDNPLDFTVFDLAERIAGGASLSRAAYIEVARELLAWREIVVQYATTGAVGDGPLAAPDTLRKLTRRICK
jgi:hypothetical protein